MRRVTKSFISIIIITVCCKLFGFIRELVMAYCFGTNEAVDMFLMAESLPSVFFGWTTAFASAFVPIYQAIRAEKNRDKSESYVSSMIFFVSLLSAVFVAIGIVFARVIIDVGAKGFSEKQKEYTYILYIICTLSYLYYSQIQLVSNYLNCHEKYIKASLPTLFISPIQTVFVLVAFYTGKYYLMAVGVAVSTFTQLVITVFFAYKEGCKIFGKLFFTSEIKQTFRLAVPLFLSTIVTRLNVLIDKMFASNLESGSLSALSYGEVIRTVILSLFSVSITSLFFPMISKSVAYDDNENVIKLLNKTLRLLIISVFPITIVGIVLSKWGIAVIYMRGSFDVNSLEKTSIAFSMYLVGVIAMLIRDVGNNLFQSYKKTKIPLIVCIILVMINVGLNCIFIKVFGYLGLPLATSIANIVIIPIEYLFLKKVLPQYSSNGLGTVLLRSVACSIVTGFMAFLYVFFLNGVFFSGRFIIKVLLLMGILLITTMLYLGFARLTNLIPASVYEKIFKKLKIKE